MKTTAISKKEFEQINIWLEKSKQEIPINIYDLLIKLVSVYASMICGLGRAKHTLLELRRAMGILPKSEKGSQLDFSQTEFSTGPDPLSEEDKKKIEVLKKEREKVIQQKKEYEKELKKLIPPAKNPAQLEFVLERPSEMLFSCPVSYRNKLEKELEVRRMDEFGKEKGLIVNYDYPTRFDLQVTVSEINYKVETVSDPTTGKTVRASTEQEGPKNYQITWRAVSNLIKMHVGFAIPINRISLMIGQPEFSSSKICRVLRNTAEMFLPIYLHLGESLADSPFISGDDTVPKVLELDTDKEDELSIAVNKHLDWASQKANGKGEKTALNVSLLVGKTEKDPRSTIRFFRTHVGSVGNLLTKVLEWRLPSSGELIFQGDLSSTNLPSAFMQQKFNLQIAGCGSHARRPFWKHKEEDEDFCYFMLRGFLALSRLEKIIDAQGRTIKNVLKYRQRYGRKIWFAMKNRCVAAKIGKFISASTFKNGPGVIIQWPPSTELYRASNYIINNFKELTLYLDHPQLNYTNNGLERALRIEKCLLNSSKFTKTKGGRVVLDILRTINATCTAAGIDFEIYITYVNCHKELLESKIELLTPFAVAKEIAKNQEIRK